MYSLLVWLELADQSKRGPRHRPSSCLQIRNSSLVVLYQIIYYNILYFYVALYVLILAGLLPYVYV